MGDFFIRAKAEIGEEGEGGLRLGGGTSKGCNRVVSKSNGSEACRGSSLGSVCSSANGDS